MEKESPNHNQNKLKIKRVIRNDDSFFYLYIVCMKFSFLSLFLLCSLFCYSQKVHSVAYANQAEVKIHVVGYENQADLKVFKVAYGNQAEGNDGLWYFVDYANQADKKVYFVDYANQSDLKIYFVKYRNQAGWRNKSKKHLLYQCLKILLLFFHLKKILLN